MSALHELRIGSRRVQPATNRIYGPEGSVRVSPRAMDVLVELADHPGAVIGKDQLLASVWEQEFVTEDVVKHAII